MRFQPTAAQARTEGCASGHSRSTYEPYYSRASLVRIRREDNGAREEAEWSVRRLSFPSELSCHAGGDPLGALGIRGIEGLDTQRWEGEAELSTHQSRRELSDILESAASTPALLTRASTAGLESAAFHPRALSKRPSS